MSGPSLMTMSEQLHQHEFLLLLLDMGEGAENLPYRSTTLETVDEIQESFDIIESRRSDIMYTLRKSDIIDVGKAGFTNSLQTITYESMKEELQEWPFDENE